MHSLGHLYQLSQPNKPKNLGLKMNQAQPQISVKARPILHLISQRNLNETIFTNQASLNKPSALLFSPRNAFDRTANLTHMNSSKSRGQYKAPKLVCANGDKTAYALSCGYIQVSPFTDSHLYLCEEHGTFLIKGFRKDGTRVLQGYSDLKVARAFLKDPKNA